MTTADRQTDADQAHEGGAYRASAVDVTAQDDAARYEGADGTTREAGGYAQHHDADATTDAGDATAADERHDDSYTSAQRLDAQDSDLRDASDTTATDEPRTDGGYPHSADSVDTTSDSTYDSTNDSTADSTATSHDSTVDGTTDGYAAGRHADSEVRTVDVGTGTDHTSSTGSAATAAATTGSAGADKLERLVPGNRVEEYTSRWDAVKGEFVDEPRQAVAKADKLVGELLDELDQLFRKQRSDLETGLDKDETSTEDLRLALRRYRSFFDRLLAL